MPCAVRLVWRRSAGTTRINSFVGVGGSGWVGGLRTMGGWRGRQRRISRVKGKSTQGMTRFTDSNDKHKNSMLCEKQEPRTETHFNQTK